MREALHTSVVNNLMYAIVCRRLDIALAICIVSWIFSNLVKEHLTIEK